MDIRLKIKNRNDLITIRKQLAKDNKVVVFTNGCFDILHRGHVEYLEKARQQGDALIIGLNSDDSVKRLKGGHRPILPEEDRAYILAALNIVDYVVIFKEDTPLETIQRVRPDVLVKGAEYGEGEIVGEEFLKEYGGRTVRFPMQKRHATSDIIRRIASDAEEDPQA